MLTFLDLDGVVVDSIEECYNVSCEIYYGYAKFPYDEILYKKYFYQYRGLVRPPNEYMCLHRALEQVFDGNKNTTEHLFHKSVNTTDTSIKELFEKKFFFARSALKELNFTNWIAMNPLTEFGETLVGGRNSNICIVTTKNKEATESLLSHYHIPASKIYTINDIKSEGSKGQLIIKILDNANEKHAIFVDDATEHLDTVKDNRVKCYFADWGYGENNGYQVFHPKMWKNYIQ